ncbi:hypothetical protein [Pedobacter sp. NJ-S-72]
MAFPIFGVVKVGESPKTTGPEPVVGAAVTAPAVPFKRPSTEVPNVMAGVVEGSVTEPVNPFAEFTVTEVTVPCPILPPAPAVAAVILPFASTVIFADLYSPGITPVFESPKGLLRFPRPVSVASCTTGPPLLPSLNKE